MFGKDTRKWLLSPLALIALFVWLLTLMPHGHYVDPKMEQWREMQREDQCIALRIAICSQP